MRNLARYIITRLFLTIPMVFILLSIVFVVLRVMPGDPVSSLLGGHAPEHVIEEKKEALGLNRPLFIQYLDYLWQICRLDFGDSMVFNQRVTTAIAEKLPATLELTLFGLLITLFLGVFLGAYAADKRRTGRDYGIRLFGIVVYCIPLYWMGLMLQLIFGIWLDVLPIAGRTGPRVFASSYEENCSYLMARILIRDCGSWYS
ncbi:MAG: ABC transporter permease [Desulfobacterales bacterium]|nr:MAG: ABC transporter permease [Desulfobacterales bacterium]